MTAETFFANFGHLADAPNGVQKLRELILQLAVQGKLVPQDERDEPASVLLERIKVEKERLVKEKKIKKQKQQPKISEKEMPFEIPFSWAWDYLGNISNNIHYGYTASADHNLADVRLLRITDIQNNKVNWKAVPGCQIAQKAVASYELENGDLLIARTGGTIGKTYLVENVAVCSVFASYLIRVIPNRFSSPRYLKIFAESPLYWGQLYEKSMGTGQPNVNGTALSQLKLPLPPLEEQKRIVAKVDQLMALCDELEARQQKQQQVRMRLNNAALDALLTAREPDEFADHWQRISTNFDLLYDHPETIAKLRAAILQLAVQGKLVPQDPNDEPASVLLERIEAEKAQLIKDGVVKKSKKTSLITESDRRFELPKSWQWVRMGNTLLKLTDGTHHSPTNTENGEYKYVTAKNIKNFGVQLSNISYVTKEVHEEIYARCNPEIGDLLYIKDGATTGIVTINDLDEPFSMLSSVALLKLPKGFYNSYLLHVLRSPFFYDLMREGMSGVAITRVTLTKMNNAMVPIAPEAEQKRIVAKVDQLMILCDELENKLNQAQKQSVKLMEATVQKLLVA